jgi:uncharacterized membrane protein YccC
LIFWNTLVRFEKPKIIPWIALRNTVGVALPLVLGAAIGRISPGLIVAIGALNVSYSDGPESYPQRARRMLVAAFCCALAVSFGGLLGREHLLLILLAGLCGFAAGMMVAVTQTAADIGVMTLATLIVFAAQAMSPEAALQSGLLALGGGLVQTALSVASWPVSRYAPERRALAVLYAALSRAAAQALAAPDLPPPASAESTDAQSALSSLAGDGSVEAERIAALLSQAERMRLSILTIARLRVRLSREPDGAAEAAILDDALAAAGRSLEAIGEALMPGGTAALSLVPSVETSRIEADAERLRASGRAMSRDARWQLDALAGQLRAAAEMAFHATPAGSAAFAAIQAAAPRRLRLGNVLARLRANLSLESSAFRHALRLGACVALGEAINRVIGTNLPGASRGYWLPMTVAIVLRPDFTGTFTRGFLRLGGTLAGLIAATAIVHFLAPSFGVEILFIAAFTFLMRCFGPANYGVFVAALTSLIVFLIGITGVAPGPLMIARGVNTLAGGAIALLAYALWPTWERNLVPERLADLFDAYRVYFEAVCGAYVTPGANAQSRLDQTRLAARLARSNAEASVARLASEPFVSDARLTALRKLLANSHRFVLAAMSLEAGLARSAPAPVRESFRTFSQGVVTTLSQLADALRGKPLDKAAMPDLREVHGELVRAGDPHFGRHALVNVETDRIVNSLNTLCEQVATTKP